MNRKPAASTLVLIAAGISLALKFLLADTTLGSNDALFWIYSTAKSLHAAPSDLYAGVDLFYLGKSYPSTIFNHPPFIIYFLRVVGTMSARSGIPVQVVLRAVSSLADTGCFLLAWSIWSASESYSVMAPRRRTAVLVAAALCPVGIMMAGFHCNTDPIMVFFLLAAVWALDRRGSPFLCGCFTGMAINIKIVPLLLLPALAFYLKGWKIRFVCFGAAAAVVLIFWGPTLAVDSRAIATNVLGYSSTFGCWGFPAIWERLQLPGAVEFYRYGKFVVAAAIMVLACAMSRMERPPDLFHQWGFCLAAFLFLASGFGIQYLYWVGPWVMVLGLSTTLTLYLAQGAFMFVVYNYWCSGMPWWFADSNAIGPWHGWIHPFQIAAWCATGWMALRYWQEITAVGAPPVERADESFSISL